VWTASADSHALFGMRYFLGMAEQFGVCGDPRCTKTGRPRSIITGEESWSYVLCDHHFATLSQEEKIAIAKETGWKA